MRGQLRRAVGRRDMVVALLSIASVGVPLAASANPPVTPPPSVAPASASLTDRARRGLVVPPAIDDVEQVCALLMSCPDLPIPPSMVPNDFAACEKTIAQQLSSPAALAFSLLVRECGLRANSCAELRTCSLRGANPSACAGRGRSGVIGYCDIDGRALSCSHDHIAGVRDCPRGGEQCSVREGQAACSLGPCPREVAEGSPPTCSTSGTRILQCEHGVLNSLDCDAFGLICAASPGADGGPPVARCAPPTATCTGTWSRCDGDVAVSCYNGHEARVQCGAAGMTCATGNEGGRIVGSCAATPAATSCDSNAPARCDGATLRYCAAGQPRALLCKALGFNRCVSGGPTGARCG
jgi:hypothetical protein